MKPQSPLLMALAILRVALVAAESARRDLQCCCHSCAASGCSAELVPGCSTCDLEGCGIKNPMGQACNRGYPAGQPGLPPGKTKCVVPAVPDEQLVNTRACDCSWINRDTCTDYNDCSIACREANPQGPCGQCYWGPNQGHLDWTCHQDGARSRPFAAAANLQCCCSICSAGGYGAQLIRNCSSCDKKGCGQDGAPGECNRGYPAGREGMPPDSTGCVVPVTPDGKLVNAGDCDCSWINFDTCMKGDTCAVKCRAANPTGPCGQCYWSSAQPSEWTCEGSGGASRRLV